MVPIAEYSRDCLKQLRADTGIDYDARAQGTLQLFRTHAARERRQTVEHTFGTLKAWMGARTS